MCLNGLTEGQLISSTYFQGVKIFWIFFCSLLLWASTSVNRFSISPELPLHKLSNDCSSRKWEPWTWRVWFEVHVVTRELKSSLSLDMQKITLYWLGKSGNERGVIVAIFFFFLKQWNTITKLWWGLPAVHRPSSCVGNALHARGLQLQQWYGLVAERGQCLSDASKLNVVHIKSVLLLWIWRILACTAVPEEKSLCQQAAGQSQGHWPSHVYNINKFLWDFQHRVLLFYCA